ncbi:MAG: TIM barrel protein [Gemmataceae bacterium]
MIGTGTGKAAAFRVGNAPCSWGTLEFEQSRGEQVPFHRMLDELVETGYTGTELGDWGYMPTDPGRLKTELERRGVVMLGAFVPVPLKFAAMHEDAIKNALKVAHLLEAVRSDPPPFLVLADANGTVGDRTQNAGRVTPELGLSAAEWSIFAEGANKVGRAVLVETGLRTVFHHHCAGYVEMPEEIAQFLELTDPSAVGLVFDTGHFAYGSGDCDVIQGMERFKDRIQYVHLKDCHPEIARQARTRKWSYFEALRHGVFCELGKGGVDFAAVLRWLKLRSYAGYVLVEQDLLPGMGTPKESARRNREYLRSIETHDV